MTRSASFLQSLYSSEAADAIFVLLTFDTDSEEPIRIVNNTQSFTHGGQEFIAFPFDIVLHHETKDGPGSVQLQIDNVDRQIGDYFLNRKDKAYVKIQIVTKNNPNNVEWELPRLRLLNVAISNASLTGEFSAHSLTQTKYPSVDFNMPGFPGLFK